MPPLLITARRAEPSDRDRLIDLYNEATAEQTAIRAIWPYTEGLAEPVAATIDTLIEATDAVVVIGEIDGVELGYLIGVEEPLLSPHGDRRIGVITHVYTEHDARGVGVGQAMLNAALTEFACRGIELFDARVSPGHRLAKNFFESNGFKARTITMHRADGEVPSGGETAGTEESV